MSGNIKKYQMKTFKSLKKQILENAPVNNVGSGFIAGVSPGEYPPIKKKLKILKRYLSFRKK